MHFSVSTPPFQDEMDMLIIDVLVINTQVTSHSNNIYLHCLGIKVVMFLILWYNLIALHLIGPL